MNLEQEVRDVMRQSTGALTVIQVTQKVAERISTDEIRSILNALGKGKELQCNRGAGPYQTTYMAPPKPLAFMGRACATKTLGSFGFLSEPHWRH
jgi:hypothetical protein